ncbi:MAG TPA: DUF4389 domain-containing protein [Streptosporangiaceae bacterium]|nr:DUF4389 domain-containing protein [Streptosporangiaceae bacterium]
MSAYTYGSASPAQVPAVGQPAPVLVSFAGPSPQSRVTVLFRIFMAIPQLIVVYALGVAAYVITLIGWFGALFTGRLPVFAADFLTGYLRWLSRVYAYLYLLTDEYPPFTLADAEYPVRVAAMPGQLNRLAVLFRIFLLIPCAIVNAVVTYGALTVFQLVSWLIVLITGRMPDTIYQALSAVLRYQLRVIGFGAMLTSAYPAELFGDMDAPAPQVHGAQPGYGAPQGYIAGASTVSGRQWLLILSAPARRLMVFFIVLGVIALAGVGFLDARLVDSIGSATAAVRVTAATIPVRDALDGYPAELRACNQKVDCFTRLDRNLATTLNGFADQLRGISMPSQAAAANAKLITSVSNAAAIFAELGTATSAAQYDDIAQSSGLQDAANQVDTDLGNLASALAS